MAVMDDEDPDFNRRSLILGGAGALTFTALCARLYKIQVLDSERYRGLSEDNQFNYRLLVPSRGRILDVTGKVLTDNADNYRILLQPDDVPDLNNTLKRITALLHLSDERVASIRRAIKRRARFAPVLVSENMDWQDFARLNLLLPSLPGVKPDVSETRQYHFGSAFCHILGYVGRVPPGMDTGDNPLLRHPGFRIGRTGAERINDRVLRGEAGALKVEVNAVGRVVRELPDAAMRAKSGEDVRLSLDTDLQLHAAKQLDGESGAACVVDVRSGEVRAMVSTPGFDPNKFARGISSIDYKALLDDPYKPLFNKAIGGAYPPASCVKPMWAAAAIQAGVANPKERIRCTGKIKFGDRVFHCWNRHGHGNLDMNGAITTSCDIYFYEMARRLGIERLHDVASELGFGHLMNFDLGGGSAGLVPSAAWKRARFNRPWAEGETLITGIGQGYLSATPIQLAVMMARMATGRAVVPTINANANQEPPRELGFSAEAMEVARRGMWAVVNQPWGTAHFAGGPLDDGTIWAGKTGTGQVRRISMAERDEGVRKNNELPWDLRDHGLFIGYAPYDDPKYAVSVLVEHGGSSHVCVPRARSILQKAMQLDLPANVPQLALNTKRFPA